MRKKMEDQLEMLTNKKREAVGLNNSLKAKYETLKKLEKEVYNKYANMEEKSNIQIEQIEGNLNLKSRERVELEANFRLNELEYKNELINNMELEYILESQKKTEELKQIEFDSQIEMIENLTKEKIKQYDIINLKLVKYFY